MSEQRVPRGKVGLWRTVLEAVDHDRARPVERGRLSEVARACLPIVPAACRAKTIDSALRSAAKKWAPESFTFDEADAPKRLPNVPVAAVVLHCAAERCENPGGWKDQSFNTRHSALPVPSGERESAFRCTYCSYSTRVNGSDRSRWCPWQQRDQVGGGERTWVFAGFSVFTVECVVRDQAGGQSSASAACAQTRWFSA